MNGQTIPPIDTSDNNSKNHDLTSKSDENMKENGNGSTRLWLESMFKEYYFKSNSNIETDSFFSEREFGFKLFDGKIRRHLTFRDHKELFANIMRYVPSDIYCSSARYQNPTANMEDKGWKGSDLIFDIDGKDLNLACAKVHNLTHCKQCNGFTNGIFSKCSICESSLVEMIDLPCKKCISALKVEVNKLVTILLDDFGIKKDTLYIYFSGNNGFHIKVVDDVFFNSSSQKRRAYIQYLQGKDFIIDNLGFKINKINNEVTILPNKTLFNSGWRARILHELGLKTRNHKLDERSFNKIIHFNNTHETTLYHYILEKISNFAVRIDPSVTMDVHRIFRLSGTINSKSGLIKTVCNNIQTFDPFVDACVIGDSITKVNSKVSLKLSLNNRRFEIKVGINRVPEFVAVYLVLKHLGDYIDA
ncbi:MAG TPA: DNA primase small subunit domain-containing protein [Candidatus Nitrosocosmicus sp.]|nr:DNA primase small subunit domain-containing protein [Candidatus Nitrosocosmicus sp.]